MIDATGARDETQCAIPVAIRETETRSEWEKSVRGARLSGNWAEDIVAIARTQVGYKESERNFIIDEEGNMQGYTRYGAWYGAKYSEWCAMFVSFCARYAAIPTEYLPKEGNCAQYKDKLGEYYEEDEDSYMPRPGDLIFFNYEGKNRLEHIGIVTDVRGGTVYTIEGNSGKAVRERKYSLGDGEIVGYMNLQAAMLAAGIIEPETETDATGTPEPMQTPESTQTPEPTQPPENGGETVNGGVAGRRAWINASQVNLRSEPGIQSETIMQAEEGTELVLIEAVHVGEETWYKAEYEGQTVYVRSDLVNIEPETNGLLGETQCACGTETDEHAQDCPLYAIPVCACGAEADENGNIVHSQDCPLHGTPECTCGAETGARAEDCPVHFVEWTLTDEATGVRVTMIRENIPENVLPGNVILRVRPLDADELAALEAQLAASGQSMQMIAYDIALIDGATGEEMQPVGSVRVCLPVPEDFTGDLSVCHASEEGLEPVASENAGDGSQAFDAGHFSVYVLLSEGAAKDARTSLLVRVEWAGSEVDAELESAVRPAQMRYYLYRNNALVTNFYVSASSNWGTELTSYPLADADGNPYEYSIQPYAGYTYAPAYLFSASYADGVCTATHTFQSTVEKMTANIVWNDYDNAFGTRPEELKAENLVVSHAHYNDLFSIAASTLTKNEDGSYTAVFENVPTTYYREAQLRHIPSGLYKFTCAEIPASYTLSTVVNDEGVFTLRYTQSAHTATAEYRMHAAYYGSLQNHATAWARVEKLGHALPETVTMTLMNGDAPAATATDATVTFQRNEDGAWPEMKATWRLPAKADDGTAIDYSNLKLSYSPSVADGGFPGFTQKLEHSEYATSDAFLVRSIFPMVWNNYVTRTWVDGDNAVGARPSNITATLLANGAPVESASAWTVPTDSSANSVAPADWTSLARLDTDGKPIEYSIRLNNVPAYYAWDAAATPAYSPETGYGTANSVNITHALALTLKSKTVTADVQWVTDGSDTERNNRPTNVNLTMYCSADNGVTWQEYWGTSIYAVAPDADGNWRHEWQLPACDAEGNELIYRVEQNPLSLYVTSYNEPDYTAETTELKITNTYTDAWDYAVDLAWDTTDLTERYHQEDVTTYNNDISLRAILSISANQDYAAGELEVRMPYALLKQRNGGVPKVELALPEAPATNPLYFFNYTIDKKDSTDPNDWEIVFTNWQDIETGYNMSTTLRYTINPYQVIDCTLAEIQATGTGQSTTQTEPVTHQSNTISYRLDTGVSTTGFTKGAPSNGNAAGTGRLYAWDTTYGPKPENFDPNTYNYVVYAVSHTSRLYYNQPFQIEFAENAGENGTIVSFYSVDSSYRVTYDEQNGVWKTAVYPRNTANATGGYQYGGTYWYVVVAHPRSEIENPLNPGETHKDVYYTNDVQVRVVAVDEHEGDKGENDQNDILVFEDDHTVLWQDYVFVYTGKTYTAYKDLGLFSNGALTRLEYGQQDVTVLFDFSATINGYNYADGYSFEIYDDAMYARLDGADSYTRLTQEDYELTTLGRNTDTYITITSSDIDRTNGELIAGQIAEGPFVLWGRRGNAGAWTEITRVQMVAGQNYYYVPAALIDGQGYTGLRLTAPEGLQGQYNVAVNSRMRLKPESELVKQWIADGVTVIVYNFMGVQMYAPDENGTYVWNDPYAATTNTLSKAAGLDAEDVARTGSHVYRRSDSTNLGPVTGSSRLEKRVDGTTYDNVNNKADVVFSINAYEYLNSALLPNAVYQGWSADSGVIYDLLPQGFAYDASYAVTVYGTHYASSTRKMATLDKLEVIDNYKGTGRQMLIFYVKSAHPDGENYSRSSSAYTGFRVSFRASISYDDIPFIGDGNNVAAYQRGDGREIASGYTEIGHGLFENNYPKTESGEYALYDMDGDGDVSKKNSLYDFAKVTLNPLTSTQTGIKKAVRASSSYFRDSDTANLSDQYTYRIQAQTSKNGKTSGLVLVDVLEKGNNGIGWKGEFVGVNTQAARQRGIDVKVYYATDASLAYSDEDKMKLDSGYWSQTPPDDLSTVTALAFDMTKKTDGTDMVFDDEQTVYVYVTMRAPEAMQEVECAYNQAGYWSTFVPLGSDVPSTVFSTSNVTAVPLRDLQDIEFVKHVPDDSTGEVAQIPLAGAVFTLYRCTQTDVEGHTHTGVPGNSSSCWQAAGYTSISNSRGEVAFTGLNSGVYAVCETSVPTAGIILLSNRYWVFTVDAVSGTVSAPEALGSNPVEMLWNETEAGGYWSLLNQRRTRTIYANKTWTDDAAHIIRPTITFDLYRNGLLYQTKELAPNASSVTFNGLYAYDLYGNYYSYEVRERPVPGYTTDNASQTARDTTSNVTLYFRNTRLGVLDIEKLVGGSDTQQAFTFYVKLTDADGNPVSPKDEQGAAVPFQLRRYAAGSDVYTEETAAASDEGIIAVTLKGGERLRIIGLPLNTNYAVTEARSGYTSTITAGAATGTTSSTATGLVTFTNTPRPTSQALSVGKTVTGDVPGAETFTFTLSADANNSEGATLPANTTAMITGSGNASFDAIQFAKTGTYVFKIKETNDGKAGYSYDESTWTATVVVTDTEGQLGVTGVTYARDGVSVDGAAAAAFANSYSTTATGYTPGVVKALAGEETPSDKSFRFTLEAAANNPEGATLPQDTTAAVTGAGTASFGTIAFTKANTYTFTIKETAGNDAGYTYDSSVWTVTVTVEDLESILTVTSVLYSKDGQAQPGVEAAAFENGYLPQGTAYAPRALKGLTGEETPVDKTFRFTLAADAGNPKGATLPQDTTATVTGEGSASFGEISFSRRGTYKFTIQEMDDGEPGYAYDASVWTLTAVVVDIGGELQVESASYAKDGVPVDNATQAAFGNEYSVEPVQYAPMAEKDVTGDTPSDEVFTFTLSADANNSEGATLPTETTATVTGSGNTSFNAITFTKAGEYTFEIRETDGGISGYSYDGSVWTLTVVVVDEESILTIDSVRYDQTDGAQNADLASFVNAYTATPTEYAPVVEKALTGDATPSSKEFRFSLEADANSPEGARLGTATATINGAGSASFGAITFTKRGTYRFTIRETAGSDAGYTYDGSVWALTVVIKDIGGALAVESHTYEKGEYIRSEARARFENQYSVTPTDYVPGVTKTVTGDVPASETFTFTLIEKEGNPQGAILPARTTATVTGNGSASFGAIRFTKAGTYAFEIREVNDGVPGYRYDASVWTLTVTVRDDESILRVVSAVYRKDGERVEGATSAAFENPYRATDTEYVPAVRKALTGQTPPSDKSFAFGLSADESNPAGATINGTSATVRGAGTANFAAIQFSRRGTYRFIIREIPGTDTGYTYDDATWTLTVVVIDAGGRLVVESAAYTAEDEAARETDAAFVNAYIPIPAQAEIAGEKRVEGEPQSDAEFTFVLTPKDAGNPMPANAANGRAVAVTTGSGNFAFCAMEFATPGLYEYTVTEINGGTLGYAYDETSYDVIIKVTDNDGRLAASVTYLKGGNPADLARFTNVYNGGSLTVSKEVKGTGASKDRAFTFTVTLTDANGQLLTGAYLYAGLNGAASGEVRDGKATFQLAHGQSVRIDALPVGARYAVEETDHSGYSASCDAPTGTITEDGAEVNFVNTRKSNSDIPKTGYDETDPRYWLLGACLLIALMAGIGRRKLKPAK